jgi:hypothetical protein
LGASCRDVIWPKTDRLLSGERAIDGLSYAITPWSSSAIPGSHSSIGSLSI